MKKIVTSAIALMFITSAAYAGTVSKNTSWEEIKANKSLKIVYPIVEVGHGMSATYDNFYMEDNTLKTDKTWEDATNYRVIGKGDTERKVVTETVTRNIETPVDYSYKRAVEWKEDSDGSLEAVGFEEVNGQHSAVMYASVYRKTTNEDHPNEFLFTKEFEIPVR